ncbi:hypothetical protein RSAG8_01694, partial [Rhizoctonia solani AG-8 WAC10335]
MLWAALDEHKKKTTWWFRFRTGSGIYSHIYAGIGVGGQVGTNKSRSAYALPQQNIDTTSVGSLLYALVCRYHF